MKMKKKVNLLRKTLMKLAVLAFVLVLPLVGTTNAVFYDQESSLSNNFSAESLDFSLRDTVDDAILFPPLFDLSNFKPSNHSTEIVRVHNDGGLSFNYGLRTEKTGGDDTFCNALKIEAKVDGTTRYNGGVLGLNISPFPIPGTGQEDWELKIGFDDNNPLLQGKTCQFNLVYRGWQLDSDGTWGFVDEEVLGNVVTAARDWTAPAIPLLYSPGNNTRLNSSHLDQTWQQVSDDSGGEVFYDYESYSSYDGTNLSNLRWTGTFSNSANTEDGRIVKHAEGAPDGDVYWRVRARDEAGNLSGWSQVWHFLISNTTPNPVLEPPSSPALGLVVLNEILPHPLGDENADRPNGEWVELYNKSASVISVAGWYISDSSDIHKILIEGTRTNTGGTDIAGHSYLVVYMNSTVLNNTGDTVNLYAGNVLPGNLIDSHTFGSTPEGKSIARFPDGSDTWFDPIPTPGGPNKLEEGPIVDFTLRNDKHAVSFQASNIKKFKTISYEITYDAQPEAKQIAGTADLGSEDSFVRENLLLGTCSTVEGKVCVYDWGMTKITLKVVLTLPNGQTTEIIKEIAY